MKYVIWSYEHEQWWGPFRCGYVDDLAAAGRYTAQEAGEIVTNSIMVEEIAIAEPIALDRGAPLFDPYRG